MGLGLGLDSGFLGFWVLELGLDLDLDLELEMLLAGNNR